MRISVFTPGEDDQGEWEVDAYTIEGGALRLFSRSEQELAAYLDLPLGGVGVGLGAGCLLAYLLVHDFQHPRAQRVRRRS